MFIIRFIIIKMDINYYNFHKDENQVQQKQQEFAQSKNEKKEIDF